VPDLHRFENNELRTELILAKPFELQLVENSEDAAAQGKKLRLHVAAPEVVLRTSRRESNPAADWQPWVDFVMSLDDDLFLSMGEAAAEGRRVSVGWGGEAEIRGAARFAESAAPEDSELNPEPVIETFRQAWKAWTASMASSSVVNDFSAGAARLRLDAIPARGGRAWLQFIPATEVPSPTAKTSVVK
jgi:hypothetical protein